LILTVEKFLSERRDKSSIGYYYTSVLISPTTRQFISSWALRSAVSNSLDRYLPCRHDEPGRGVVVPAALGESIERARAWKSPRGKPCRKKRNPSTRKRRYELRS